MKLVKLIIYTFLLLFSLPAIGQVGSNYAAGIRSLGMGHISASLDDLNAVYSNPAALSANAISGIQLSALQRFNLSELKELSIGGGLLLGKNNVVFASIRNYGFSEYTEQKLAIGYAMKVMENTSLSLQLDVFNLRIDEYGNSFKPGFEIGIHTKPFKEVAISAVVANPIRSTQDDPVQLPGLITIGASITPSQLVTLFVEVEKDIDYAERFKAGIEYKVQKQLFLRLGAATGPSSMTMGVGYRLSDGLQIDAGAAYNVTLGLTPGVGISFNPQPKVTN